jgi:predicted ATP-binding protein involved in virulence
MHLHPEWQQVVLADLTRAFPRMQFIVTTHSPQVLTTVRAEQIRIIGRTGEQWYGKRPAVSPLARPSGDALAYIMGVNPRPPLDILEILHDYEQMVRCGQMGNPQAHAIRARLDAAGVDIPEADMALWQFLGQHAREYGHG